MLCAPPAQVSSSAVFEEMLWRKHVGSMLHIKSSRSFTYCRLRVCIKDRRPIIHEKMVVSKANWIIWPLMYFELAVKR